MTTLHRRVAAGTATVVLALSATACSGDPNIDVPDTTRSSAANTDSSQGQIDPSVVGGGSPATTPVPNCNADMDVAETRFEMFARTKKVLISQNGGAKMSDGRAYHFKVAENQFDACQPLSWITLNGANGDIAQMTGTGAAAAQAVVFFLGDQLVTHPMPVEVHTVESVTRTAPDAVTMQVGVATRSTAEGVTEHYTVDYVAKDGALVEKSSTFPKDKYDQYMKLDFDAGPVPMDAPPTRLGNAHTK